MHQSILVDSHEKLFLEQGWLLALGFKEGWACFRIQHKEWANLEPWPLGAVAALSNLSTWNLIQDASSNKYLEPYDVGLIYHTFWGVTPTPARIYIQYPPRAEIGSMLSTARSITGDIGYIDGRKSPFYGPYSRATELFTVKEKYPQLQVYNPLNDSMYNVMLNFDQRHYTYEIIKDKDLIRDMLIGNRSVKKYSMGPAWPDVTTAPDWLKKAVTTDLLAFTKDIMAGKTVSTPAPVPVGARR